MRCERCDYENSDDALFCGRCSNPLVGSEDLEAIREGVTDLSRKILEKVLPEHLVIVGHLGKGGMATVYEAEDRELGMRVALKVLPIEAANDEELVKRFKREARLVSTLKHDNIVPFFFMETTGGFHFFTMALMRGGSLQDRIDSGPLSWGEAIEIVTKLTRALAYAHGMGVIHRDIKPDNIMFDEKGEPHLADFGIAKGATSTQLTATQVMLGTPAYMSPEQVTGKKPDERSDLYSLGAVLFHALTGLPPFPGDDVLPILSRQITEIPPKPSSRVEGIPDWVDQITATLLEKGPEYRYQSADELLADLEQGTVSKAREAPTIALHTQEVAKLREKPTIWRKYRLPLLAAAAGLILLVSIALIEVVNREEKPEPVAVEDDLEAIPVADAVVTEEPEATTPSPEVIQTAIDAYTMVTLEAGEFRRGGRGGDSDERPAHLVTLDAFSIGRTEVTQALWTAVMEENPSCKQGNSLPVTSVSWLDVQEFLKRLREATGKAYRLPSEAEWEFAARDGRSGGVFRRVARQAWFARNATEPNPVATKDASGNGLYDMLGNVWEWCADIYDPDYYQNSPSQNPSGPSEGSRRVIRGGAFDETLDQLRPANRHSHLQNEGSCSVGFRLVL